VDLEFGHTDGEGPRLPYLNVPNAGLGTPREGDATTSMIVAGDLYWPSVREDEEQTQFTDKVHPWQPFVPLIGAQDLSVVNMESPLTGAPASIVKAGPRMKSQPSFATEIARGGFGVLSLANNHIRDFGDEGLWDTLAVCRDAGLVTVGAGPSLQAATQAVVVPCGHLKVALISATDNGPAAAGRLRAGAGPLRNGLTQASVAQAATSADAVVVLLHAGNEFYPFRATSRRAGAVVRARRRRCGGDPSSARTQRRRGVRGRTHQVRHRESPFPHVLPVHGG
jgi:hypothetical protein